MKLRDILETFENEDLKDLMKVMSKTIPDYWKHVAASSTGKYHPAYSLGEGGLMRHTIALCRYLNYIFTALNEDFTSRERDLLRIAGIMHDSRKSGDQSAYESNHYTNFNHPLQAAAIVRTFKGDKWNDDEIELIAHAIERHMGQWNVDKRTGEILPTPENKYDKALHLADYLASRKDLIVTFDVENNDTDTMPFGKYRGVKLSEIPADYLQWCINNLELNEDLKGKINNILTDKMIERKS